MIGSVAGPSPRCSDDGTWIDRGGAWIGPGQDRIKALMAEFGAEEYKRYVDGDAMMILDGKQHRYSGTIPWAMSPWAIANLGAGLLEVELMCKTIPFDAPWEAKKAVEWDRISLGSGSTGICAPNRRARCSTWRSPASTPPRDPRCRC